MPHRQHIPCSDLPPIKAPLNFAIIERWEVCFNWNFFGTSRCTNNIGICIIVAKVKLNRTDGYDVFFT
jgi:hypothetical protein